MDTLSVFYLVAVFHFLIAVFGSDEYRPVSIIIFLAAFINILIVDLFGLLGNIDGNIPLKEWVKAYVSELDFWIWYNGCTAMLLCFLPHNIKFTIHHAIILIFACLCHLGIIWELTKTSNFASYFIYDYYQPLIILVGILQMVGSLDGFTGAFIRISDSVRGLVFYHRRSHQNCIRIQNRKGQA